MKSWRDGMIQSHWCGGAPQKKAEGTLKQALTQVPALRLPDPEKAFQLYVQEKQGIALGVLTQRFGPEPQPVAYLSKRSHHLPKAGLPAFKILQLLQSWQKML